jgi:TPR repeat protein
VRVTAMNRATYAIIMFMLFCCTGISFAEDFRSRKDCEILNDQAEAIRCLQKPADQGDAEAQAFLGDLYWHREDAKPDYTNAMKWYRRAADQGHTRAQNSLGLMYSLGLGVTRNLIEGTKWFRKAAEQGDEDGQYNLGMSYAHGLGITF